MDTDPIFQERMLLAADRALEGQELKDEREVEAFFERELVGRLPEELAERFPMSPAQQAGDLALRALGESDAAKAGAMAKEALALDPDCLDALTLLASQETDDQVRADALEGLVARTRELREALEVEAPGQLWDYVVARPHLRLLFTASVAALEADRPHVAAELSGLALDLDEEDQVGVLPMHLQALALQGRWASAWEELQEWDVKIVPELNWMAVLFAFQAKGIGVAFKALRQARKVSPQVESLLTGRSTAGSARDHAAFKVLAPLWESAPEALAWLKGRPGR